jgi:hypothetical protein
MGCSKNFELFAGTVVPDSDLGSSAFRAGFQVLFWKRNPWGRLDGFAVATGFEQSLLAIRSGPSSGTLAASQGVFATGRLYLVGPLGVLGGVAGVTSEVGVPAAPGQPSDHYDVQFSGEARYGLVLSLGALDFELQGPPYSTAGWTFRTSDQLFAALLGFEVWNWR